MSKEGLLTANEVAGYLKCSVSTVRRLVVRAEIPHFRVSKLVRFRRRDIDAWLLNHREKFGKISTNGKESALLCGDVDRVSRNHRRRNNRAADTAQLPQRLARGAVEAVYPALLVSQHDRLTDHSRSPE